MFNLFKSVAQSGKPKHDKGPRPVTYESRHVHIPTDFLSGPSERPVTLYHVPFASSAVPEYEGCFAVTLDNVLTEQECRQLIQLAERSVVSEDEGEPWRPAMIAAGPGIEAPAPGYRESDRIVWDHQGLTDLVWERCCQADGLRDMLAVVNESNGVQPGEWKFSRVNERIRFLKYSKGNFFKPHCDGPYWYEADGKTFQTHYTLHLYLNDSAEYSPNSELVGGATSFLSRDRKRRIDVNPKAGSVLIFQHKRLLHEGATVQKGEKFTARMDILYDKDRRAADITTPGIRAAEHVLSTTGDQNFMQSLNHAGGASLRLSAADSSVTEYRFHSGVELLHHRINLKTPSVMEASSTAAAWLSFAVTAFGLGGLISQASAINEKMDPFHANRTAEYLGIWFQRQASFPWWRIARPPPVGPVVSGKLSEGFCGINDVHLVRVPLRPAGKAGWAIILSIIHVTKPNPGHSTSRNAAEKGFLSGNNENALVTSDVADEASWGFLEERPLVRHHSSACIMITRTTLITLMSLTNARAAFQYSDAAGFRAGYASYSGQWYITWPIGQEAFVKFAPHDSHSTSTDMYPLSFHKRVDRCVQMLSGIVCAPSADFQVGFCGRKPPGVYTLQHVSKGFPGAHGSRHLYNMMGGKVYEVDFMSVQKERAIIEQALDSLPWTSLSWSIHRGMRDILVAYAKPVMTAHRQELATLLKRACEEQPHLLDSRGWNPSFVRQNMGEMAASAILAGQGNSGDLVRVVTDIALALVGSWDISQLDQVVFWTRSTKKLDTQGVVALTKLFVLEWSNEFD
ncbi:hypothetical protein S40293_06653 [Stachybotrys chartarum IBT 40293]|nr:hypothetical protein S40293_06653 [Stachybotrys chartarum IBT 40293]